MILGMSPKMDVIFVDYSQEIMCLEMQKIGPFRATMKAEFTGVLYSSDFINVPTGCYCKQIQRLYWRIEFRRARTELTKFSLWRCMVIWKKFRTTTWKLCTRKFYIWYDLKWLQISFNQLPMPDVTCHISTEMKAILCASLWSYCGRIHVSRHLRTNSTKLYSRP